MTMLIPSLCLLYGDIFFGNQLIHFDNQEKWFRQKVLKKISRLFRGQSYVLRTRVFKYIQLYINIRLLLPLSKK